MPDTLVKLRDILTSRMFVKGVFLASFVWSCWTLWRFEQWARGLGPYVHRPESVAGILPVGHFTSFFAWVKGGGWDELLPAGLMIIIGAITLSVLFKRGFCGWICPLGTVWEGAALLGKKLIGHNLRLPRWLDLIGRGFRYVIAAAALLFLLAVSVGEAVSFRQLPYMWVADLKILHTFMSVTFIVVFLLAFVLSMLFGPVWCRWLCPLGGWYSVLGMASPCVVRREESTCIHCSACTDVCHAFIDVERATTVRHVECDGCMDCVKICPAEDCLTARGPGRVRIAPWAWPLLAVGVWLAIYGTAKLAGAWDTTIPDQVFQQVINSGLLEQRTPGGL
jgi:polyferredoxin